MAFVSGDVVSWHEARWVVVDVSTFHGDETLDRVVLRPKDEPFGALEVCHPREATFLQHLDQIDGWKETSYGQWRRA